jgi:hypothetical protein
MAASRDVLLVRVGVGIVVGASASTGFITDAEEGGVSGVSKLETVGLTAAGTDGIGAASLIGLAGFAVFNPGSASRFFFQY